MEPRFGRIIRASLYITVCLALSCAPGNDRPRRSSKATQTKPETPPALQQIDHKATDVVITVPTGDWPRMYALIQDINETWLDFRNQVYGVESPLVARPSGTTLSPRSTYVDRLDAAVYVLQYAATAQDASRTMNTANLISALAGDLYGYYAPTTPPEIHRISVLERQVVLDAADDNLTDIAGVLDQIREAWHRVRPSVEDKASTAFANQIEESIVGQQVALDNGDNEVLTSRAKRTLELLAEVQQIYQMTGQTEKRRSMTAPA